MTKSCNNSHFRFINFCCLQYKKVRYGGKQVYNQYEQSTHEVNSVQIEAKFLMQTFIES